MIAGPRARPLSARRQPLGNFPAFADEERAQLERVARARKTHSWLTRPQIDDEMALMARPGFANRAGPLLAEKTGFSIEQLQANHHPARVQSARANRPMGALYAESLLYQTPRKAPLLTGVAATGMLTGGSPRFNVAYARKTTPARPANSPRSFSPRHGERGGGAAGEEQPPPEEKALKYRWGEALDRRFKGKHVTAFEKINSNAAGASSKGSEHALSKEEVLKSILALQLNVQPGELDELMKELDTNKDGVVDYEEFKSGLFRVNQHARQPGGMPAEATGLFFGENKPRTAMVLKHDLGAETGGLATEDEINKYVESLRTAIDAKYTLLRKAFQALDRDRNNYLSMDEIFDCVRKFALPIPASHIHQVFHQVLDGSGQHGNANNQISYNEFVDALRGYEKM